MKRALISPRLIAYALLTALALGAVVYTALEHFIARASGSPLSMRACTDPSLTQSHNSAPALFVHCGGFLE
jgi:hypothetical protein